jgi:hypothetical protein
MSKYEQFQHLFVEDGDRHSIQSDACFDVIDQLTHQLIEYSEWHADDVECISLDQPILPGKPKQITRVKRSGKNRDRIRDVATWVNNGWSLGIRFRLRPHMSVSFQPREVMFVLPILVINHGGEEITVQTELAGTQYRPEQFDALVELTFERIQTILEQGVHQLIGRSHRPEELHDLGFVLDSEDLEELGIETTSKSAIQPARQEKMADPQPEPEIAPGNDPSVSLAATPVMKPEVEELTAQASEAKASTSSPKKNGRSRKQG